MVWNQPIKVCPPHGVNRVRADLGDFLGGKPDLDSAHYMASSRSGVKVLATQQSPKSFGILCASTTRGCIPAGLCAGWKPDGGPPLGERTATRDDTGQSQTGSPDIAHGIATSGRHGTLPPAASGW